MNIFLQISWTLLYTEPQKITHHFLFFLVARDSSKILCIQINLTAAKSIFPTVSSGWVVMQTFEEKNIKIVLLRHTEVLVIHNRVYRRIK